MPAVTLHAVLLWPKLHISLLGRTFLKTTINDLYSSLFSHLLAHTNRFLIWDISILVQSCENVLLNVPSRLRCLQTFKSQAAAHWAVNGTCVTPLSWLACQQKTKRWFQRCWKSRALEAPEHCWQCLQPQGDEKRSQPFQPFLSLCGPSLLIRTEATFTLCVCSQNIKYY